MYSQVMDITPEMASEMLKKNHEHNRPLDRSRVGQYKEIIASGEFMLDPFGLVFDTNGTLINGQHRLTAIASGNIPVKMNVTFDADPETIKILDSNKPRTLLQRRAMAGMNNDNVEIASVKFLFEYEYGYVSNDIMIWNFLDKYSDSVKKIATYARIRNGKIRRAPVAAGLLSAYMCGVSESTIKSFCEVVTSGFYNDDTQSAAIVFAKYLDDQKIYNQAKRYEMFAVTQEALNCFVKGVSRRVLWREPKPIYYEGIPREIILGMK